MNEFLQTLAIATVPSIVTGIISYIAAIRNSKSQIEAIKAQNKADIEKLVEQNRVDIEALKEKHKLDMESKEKEYKHQIEVMKLQNQNELTKEGEMMKNQLAFNLLGGAVSGLFAPESPFSGKINEMLVKGLEDAMNNGNK
ncbi:MAG: hypothetical protein IKW30_04435 [Lachnospiraceae bacterium]|nr:hypothetical protein [Lachnospiraceae bacterium]